MNSLIFNQYPTICLIADKSGKILVTTNNRSELIMITTFITLGIAFAAAAGLSSIAVKEEHFLSE